MSIDSRRHPATKTLLRLGLGGLLLVAIVAFFGPTSITAKLSTVDWVLATPALAGLVMVHLLQIGSWRLLSRILCNIELPWFTATRAYYAGQIFGSLTPGNLGADVYRATMFSSSAGWKPALVPIIAQRIFSYAGLILLALGALVILYAPLWVGAASLGVLAACAILWTLSRDGSAHAKLRRLWSRLLQRAGRSADGRLPSPRACAGALALSVTFHFACILLTFVLLQSVQTGADAAHVIAVFSFARLASLLPFVPYGLGLQEGAFVLALPTVGVSPEAAIAVSLLGRLALLGTLLVGAGFFCLGTGTNTAQPKVAVAGSTNSRP
jgi:uncharacterized membrane protein YbhN (UPF0104 family)